MLLRAFPDVSDRCGSVRSHNAGFPRMSIQRHSLSTVSYPISILIWVVLNLRMIPGVRERFILLQRCVEVTLYHDICFGAIIRPPRRYFAL